MNRFTKHFLFPSIPICLLQEKKSMKFSPSLISSISNNAFFNGIREFISLRMISLLIRIFQCIATIGALVCATVALLIGCAGCGCGKKKGKRTKSVRQLPNLNSVKSTSAPDKPISTAYHIEPVTNPHPIAAETPQTATDFTGCSGLKN